MPPPDGWFGFLGVTIDLMREGRMDGTGRSRLMIAISLLAAFLDSNFWIDWILRGFSGFGIVVSSLEAPGEPNAGLLRVTDVVCALLVVSLLPAARRALGPGWEREVFVACTVVFAVGASIAAFVPMPCGIGVVCDSAAQRRDADIHDIASIVSETALFLGVLAVWFATRHVGPRWLSTSAWWLFWLGGVIATALFAWFGWETKQDEITGYIQRLHITTVSIWIVCIGLMAAGRARVPTSEGVGR